MVWQETKVVVFLNVWGCDAYGFSQEKLEPKADKYIFMEYPLVTVGYTFYLRSKDKNVCR